MARKTDQPAPVAAEAPSGADIASAQAPFVYFEDARTFGHLNGVVRITLEAGRIYPGAPGERVKNDRVMVAHLRTSIAGARSLKAALEGALLLATPAKSEQQN